MKKKVLSALLIAAMTASMFAGCGSTDDGSDANKTSENKQNSNDDASGDDGSAADPVQTLIDNTTGTVSLTLWCSETEAYQTVMAKLVEDFKATYPDVDFNIEIGAESEADCKDDLLKDVEAGADVFVFADDQINELVQAKALNPVSVTYTYDPNESFGKEILDAASMDGQLYAYPLTASNGFFLFYNTEYISDEDAATWESLVAAAEASGKKVGVDFSNAWYLYGFFSGAGLSATLADDGTTTICDWNSTTNSPTGAEVAQAIVDICKSDAVISIKTEDAADKINNGELVAFVDGTWSANTIKNAYGDGYAASKLPTFQAGGQDVQMGSFAGYKLVGVNAYSDFTGWAMLLAEFITNENSQYEIYQATAEGPANTNAIAKASSPELDALAEQAPYADLQRVGGNFWESGNSLGQILFDGTNDVQKALDDAVAGITAPVVQE